jgi:putative copper export protein
VTAASSVAHLADTLTIVRLSLHVLAAAVWVGGQFVLAGLIPTGRGLGEGATQKVARAFGRLSWPAFGVLLATGIWNEAVVGRHASGAWNAVFAVKMVTVVIAGVATGLHTRATTPGARGAFAGTAALASTAALVLGVALAG